VLLLFLLPLLVPSITSGIPLATVLYQARLVGTMNGVIVAALVPTVPFVVLVMTPYIEQIDPRLVLVRTIAMFELTFLTAGPDSQTPVVVLYYSVFAAGVRATQSVDAMAVTYTLAARG
jgi:putative spermidine/putrescine transport system permease protein